MKQKETILSGMRPTGPLHIGNYLGALKHFVALQEDYRCFFMIADEHALDTNATPAERRQYTLSLAAEYLAAGLNPKKSTLFVQSQVPEHAELQWLFGSLVPLGELERMTQYKDKSARGTANVTAALLNYPVLMAADILLYLPKVVPVGDDQTQHVEMSRYIARRFNRSFGVLFPEPKPLFTHAARVMSLTEPERKMSKSEPAGCLFLSDTPDAVREKVKRAVTATASTTGRRSPGVENLFVLLRACGGSPADIARFERAEADGSIRYSDLKTVVADAIIQELAPFQKRYTALMKKPKSIETVLRAGSKTARRVAGATLRHAKERMGLLV